MITCGSAVHQDSLWLCRLRSRVIHPDKFSSSIAEATFQQLTSSYERLLDLVRSGTSGWGLLCLARCTVKAALAGHACRKGEKMLPSTALSSVVVLRCIMACFSDMLHIQAIHLK